MPIHTLLSDVDSIQRQMTKTVRENVRRIHGVEITDGAAPAPAETNASASI